METIRPVQTIAEYDACEEIQRRAWGYADLDVVPTNELISIAKAGGLVLGAFLGPEAAARASAGPTRTSPAERMVGFCFGLVGRDAKTGGVYHYSRMVGVDPEFRGAGIAQRLKRAQRDAVLAQGLDEMRWTFDPLAALNAGLNLDRLGAEAVAFLRDLYGDATSSPLHAGGTDRLLARWRLSGVRLPADATAPAISIPLDLAPLKRRPGDLAEERARIRAAFEDAFARGFVAVAFTEGTYRFARRPDVA